VRLGGLGGPPVVKTESNPTPLPFLKDDAKTAKTWGDLAEMTREKPALRSWYLLATRERKNYSEPKPETVLPERRRIVTEQLNRVQAQWTKAKDAKDSEVLQRDCRNRARDLVELYADESDAAVKSVVDAAKALLGEMRK
jgi:hypothetical protein